MNNLHQANTNIIRSEDLVHLPSIVQRYLTYAGVVGATEIETVHLKYTGQFRLGLDKPWMALNVEQAYNVYPPEFQWDAKFKLFGIPILSGQDVYKNGYARMIGKLAGLFTFFDVNDDNLLQGTMMRYLQEMVWFPTAYLSEYITWNSVDEQSADATFKWGGKEVTGRFFFDEIGRVVEFRGERYNSEKETHLPWITPMKEYINLAGLNIPSVGIGKWQYPDTVFTYIQMRLTEIHYNELIQSNHSARA